MDKLTVGDIVMIADTELPIKDNWMGEGNKFKHQGPYIVEEMGGSCCTKLSGQRCRLGPHRFTLYVEKEQYQIY